MPLSSLRRTLLLLQIWVGLCAAADIRVALFADSNCERRNGTRPIGNCPPTCSSCTALSESTAVLYRYDRSSRQALRRFHFETDRCDDGSPSTSTPMSFTRCTPTEGGLSEQLVEEEAEGTLPAAASSAAAGSAAAAAAAGAGIRRTICTDSCKIAWVGNSYTYYHDLPVLLADLAASASPPVAIDHASVTVGGSSLSRLSEDPRVVEMLARDWDYVVLQDQSQIPGGARPLDRDLALLALRDFYKPYLKRVRAEAILYSTWGRRNGDPAYPDLYPDFSTMTERTTEGYEMYRDVMANPPLLDAILSPAGAAFANVHADDEAAFDALYDPDGSHPSVRGSYLVSCVFYGVLTGRPSVGLPYSPAEIGAEARVYLQVMADRAVAAEFRAAAEVAAGLPPSPPEVTAAPRA
jgi:hypothetical protein